MTLTGPWRTRGARACRSARLVQVLRVGMLVALAAFLASIVLRAEPGYVLAYDGCSATWP